MDVREFQEKLKKMQELAKEQGGSLRAEQILSLIHISEPTRPY